MDATTQEPRGYVPADTVVYAGLPITWQINATSPYDCSAFLRVPSLGVQANLTAGTNSVSLPALPVGVTTFTCVMGMYDGTLVAVRRPASSTAP
jgi:plastocyanin domain-containing protein